MSKNQDLQKQKKLSQAKETIFKEFKKLQGDGAKIFFRPTPFFLRLSRKFIKKPLLFFLALGLIILVTLGGFFILLRPYEGIISLIPEESFVSSYLRLDLERQMKLLDIIGQESKLNFSSSLKDLIREVFKGKTFPSLNTSEIGLAFLPGSFKEKMGTLPQEKPFVPLLIIRLKNRKEKELLVKKLKENGLFYTFFIRRSFLGIVSQEFLLVTSSPKSLEGITSQAKKDKTFLVKLKSEGVKIKPFPNFLIQSLTRKPQYFGELYLDTLGLSQYLLGPSPEKNLKSLEKKSLLEGLLTLGSFKIPKGSPFVHLTTQLEEEGISFLLKEGDSYFLSPQKVKARSSVFKKLPTRFKDSFLVLKSYNMGQAIRSFPDSLFSFYFKDLISRAERLYYFNWQEDIEPWLKGESLVILSPRPEGAPQSRIREEPVLSLAAESRSDSEISRDSSVFGFKMAEGDWNLTLIVPKIDENELSKRIGRIEEIAKEALGRKFPQEREKKLSDGSKVIELVVEPAVFNFKILELKESQRKIHLLKEAGFEFAYSILPKEIIFSTSFETLKKILTFSGALSFSQIFDKKDFTSGSVDSFNNQVILYLNPKFLETGNKTLDQYLDLFQGLIIEERQIGGTSYVQGYLF